jgi:hypothetical protein
MKGGTAKSMSKEVITKFVAGILVLVLGTLVLKHEGSIPKLEAQVESLRPQMEHLQSIQERISRLEAQVEILVSQVQNLQVQIQNLQSTIHELEGLEVVIVEPQNYAAVGCETITEDNQCAINVDLEIAGILPEAARVRMLVRVEGGDEWWVSGGEGLPGPDNKCSIGFVTLGSADGPDQRYELVAIITEQALEPGSRHTVIPDHIARSPSVSVLARKGNE